MHKVRTTAFDCQFLKKIKTNNEVLRQAERFRAVDNIDLNKINILQNLIHIQQQ